MNLTDRQRTALEVMNERGALPGKSYYLSKRALEPPYGEPRPDGTWTDVDGRTFESLVRRGFAERMPTPELGALSTTRAYRLTDAGQEAISDGKGGAKE